MTDVAQLVGELTLEALRAALGDGVRVVHERGSDNRRSTPTLGGRSRSRLRGEAIEEYGPRAAEMLALAQTMPGLVDVKSFTADDGERVTLVTIADAESQRAWREHPEHRVAQRAGRDRFYAEYSIQVCECTGVRTFAAALGVGPDASGPDGGDSTVG